MALNPINLSVDQTMLKTPDELMGAVQKSFQAGVAAGKTTQPGGEVNLLDLYNRFRNRTPSQLRGGTTGESGDYGNETATAGVVQSLGDYGNEVAGGVSPAPAASTTGGGAAATGMKL